MKNFTLWIWTNRDAVTKIWLLIISLVLLSTAINVSRLNRDADKQRSDSARTAKIAAAQSYASCQRSRLFGPELAKAYKKYHILTPRSLNAFIAGIPEQCSK
jgi:hypothetical protein